MEHHTKNKGDLAVAKTIADLTEKGYDIFLPLSEHLPIDLIAHKSGEIYRIQVKHRASGFLEAKTQWADKNGSHSKKYSEKDFDYYALYLPQIDRISYPSIKFAGCTIRCEECHSPAPFYWFEDFSDLTDEAEKRTSKEFGWKVSDRKKRSRPATRPAKRKVDRPEIEVLTKQIRELGFVGTGKIYGVSDNAIRKWVKHEGLDPKQIKCQNNFNN